MCSYSNVLYVVCKRILCCMACSCSCVLVSVRNLILLYSNRYWFVRCVSTVLTRYDDRFADVMALKLFVSVFRHTVKFEKNAMSYRDFGSKPVVDRVCRVGDLANSFVRSAVPV